MMIMSCAVAVNTELANTGPLAPARHAGLVSCEPLVPTFLSTDQHIALFYEALLLKDTLFYAFIYVTSHQH